MVYSRSSGSCIYINKRKLINLCSNDYLGINIKNKIINKTQTSSRLINSESIFKILEKKLAKYKMQENALVYANGYMANLGSVSTLIKKNDIVFSDELNHASIVDACKLTNAKILVYKHNDIDDLVSKIKDQNNRKFIITEGIFSMDGDFANLKQITEIAEKNNIITILDDAHGDFVVGNDGMGTASYFNVEKKIDLYISSLSKGLGSFGGYIASQKNFVDLCINKSRQFIYTTALPSSLVQLALYKLKSDRKKRREKLYKNIKYLISGLKRSGYEIKSFTHIIPIVIGKEKHAIEFGEYLLKNGIYAMPIRYPTVAKNRSRIRISVTAYLSIKQLENIINIFEIGRKKFKLC